MNSLPLVITNNTNYNKKISLYIKTIIGDPKIDTIMFATPYISDYFVDMIRESSTKVVLGLVDKDPPIWTKQAIRKLIELKNESSKKISVKCRPKNSGFLHMKLLIPFYFNPNLKENKYYAKCAMVGSVNLTKKGIEKNDEILIILRDRESIEECVKTMDALWKGSSYPDDCWFL